MACNNTMISVNDTNGLIIIGVWDTLNVRSQTFDISPWVEKFPGGQLIVLHQRDGDELPYQAANVVVDDGTATWTFDEADSGAVGYGSASLVWIVGDEYKARSSVYRTYTASTIGIGGTTPPDPFDDWYQRILAASLAAQSSAEAAAASASAAETAKESAEIAEQNAQAAAAQAAETAQDILLPVLPTDTASGDPATFSDGADGIPVKSLSVTFAPVQGGSGTPSPENVRPITGRDEITITANGEAVTVSLGGTMYGGTLNATTGEITITHLVHDLASLAWDTRRTGSTNKTLSANLPNQYPTASAVMAEQYAYISTVTSISYFNSPDSVPVGIYTYASTPNNGILYINLPLPSSPAGLVAYPLATPQTLTLTPTEVDTIRGANSIGADAGAVTVTYRADIGLYIDKRLAEG